MSQLESQNGITNGAAAAIDFEVPYAVEATVEGTSSMLFHRWDCEAVQIKADSKKGSKAKKTDDVESYVYRDDKNNLAIPGEYFRQSIIHAAKYMQDPRSPRKSAMDLFKAGVVVLDELCSLGTKDWSYLDRRRVLIQRNGITRVRPAIASGWRVKTTLQVLLPEYIDAQMLNERLQAAGRLIGVGDFRPTFGRFQVVNFKLIFN